MTERQDGLSRFAQPHPVYSQPESLAPQIPSPLRQRRNKTDEKGNPVVYGNAGGRFASYAGNASQEFPLPKKSTISLIRRNFAEAGMPISDGTQQSQLREIFRRSAYINKT